MATIVEDHGAPVAAIVHNASLADERDLIAAVGAAATLTLENERLDAELRAKVEELRDQRRRGWWRRHSTNGAGWSATSTTGRSSGSCRWR